MQHLLVKRESAQMSVSPTIGKYCKWLHFCDDTYGSVCTTASPLSPTLISPNYVGGGGGGLKKFATVKKLFFNKIFI